MYPKRYDYHVYVIHKTETFDKWLLQLKDIKAKGKILKELEDSYE